MYTGSDLKSHWAIPILGIKEGADRETCWPLDATITDIRMATDGHESNTAW
jgi:hypothetical protein